MPKGPRGEKRPSGATRIDEEDDRKGAPLPSPAQQLGKLGGAARAKKLTAGQRAEIARKAAAKRWERD